MEQSVLDGIVSKFENAKNKDGLIIVKAAMLAKAPDEKIEKYMTENLSVDKLIEVLIAISDEVSDETLMAMTKRADEISLEEMRSIRFSARGDRQFEILAERVARCTDVIEQAEILKVCKELEKTNKILRELKKSGQDVLGDTVPNNAEKSEDNKQVSKQEDDKHDKEISERASEASSVLRTVDYAIVSNDGVVLAENETVRPNKKRWVSLFKKSNHKKIIEQEKRSLALKEFIKAGCSGEKLKAFTEAIKKGVSADFLRMYIDKDVAADELRLYTKAYLAIYDPDTEYGFDND